MIAVAIVVATLILSGCGISLDDHPRAIETSTSSTSTTMLPPIDGALTNLYYVLDEALVPVPMTVPDRGPSTVISELLKPLPKSETQNLMRSAIPSGTTLRSANQRGTLLTIDLSEEFGNVLGVSRQRALGQIVLSVTQIDGVREVRFQIKGDNIQIASPERGDTATATACDFKSLLATNDQLKASTSNDPDLFEELKDPLASRANALAKIC